MSERIKVAILGTGSIGFRHLQILREQNDVEPIAVPLRASRRSELNVLGFATAASLAEAAARGCRFLIIATDTGRHVNDALSGLELGMDILVEKPMAPSASEAMHIIRRARNSDRRVFVGCCLRFSESLNAFRAGLPEIGSPHTIRIECQSYLPDWHPERNYRLSYSARAAEGGVLRDLIHEIDYASWIFGWPESLWGTLINTARLQIESEEIADLSCTSQDKYSILSIYLDYLTFPTRRRMIAFGDKGTLEWNAITQTVTRSNHHTDPETSHYPQELNDFYVQQDRAFLRSRMEKADSRLATALEGFKALAVCDAARISSETRQKRDIAYDLV